MLKRRRETELHSQSRAEGIPQSRKARCISARPRQTPRLTLEYPRILYLETIHRDEETTKMCAPRFIRPIICSICSAPLTEMTGFLKELQ